MTNSSVNPVQPLNALSPIEITELGITIDTNPVQPLNALSPIETTELGIDEVLHPTIKALVDVLIIALQLSRDCEFCQCEKLCR